VVADLFTVLLPALEEQLAASHHEAEEAHLWEALLEEDHERTMVAGIVKELLSPSPPRNFSSAGPSWGGAWIPKTHRVGRESGTS
jgi:hypothetical protein